MWKVHMIMNLSCIFHRVGNHQFYYHAIFLSMLWIEGEWWSWTLLLQFCLYKSAHCVCTFNKIGVTYGRAVWMSFTAFMRSGITLSKLGRCFGLRFLSSHSYQFMLLWSVGSGAGLPVLWLCSKACWNLGGSKAAAQFVDQQRWNILYDWYLHIRVISVLTDLPVPNLTYNVKG